MRSFIQRLGNCHLLIQHIVYLELVTLRVYLLLAYYRNGVKLGIITYPGDSTLPATCDKNSSLF